MLKLRRALLRARRPKAVLVCLLVVAAVVLTAAAVTWLAHTGRPSTAGVATAHFKKALDDLTTRQDELCGELARTRVNPEHPWVYLGSRKLENRAVPGLSDTCCCRGGLPDRTGGEGGSLLTQGQGKTQQNARTSRRWSLKLKGWC